MSTVFVAGNRVSLNPKDAIGKGGEADVYLYNGQALKIYKTADHPDLTGDPHGIKAAVERLETQQRKLPLFPKNLPDNVISPIQVADNGKGFVLGYTMRFLSGAEVLMSYTDRGFRSRGISQQTMLQVLTRLHDTVREVHMKGVVLGDFNDLNVLIKNNDIYLVDMDSAQFSVGSETFYCTAFTNKFVDPLLCDSNLTHAMLIKPHNEKSDWYAYCVMVMQCLLYVDPYGGVYKPKDVSKRIPHEARPLHRITVFDPEVKYPKPAIPYGMLPDDLLQVFHRTFVQDSRETLPVELLRTMRWTECLNCGTEHARPTCPNCAAATPGIVTQVTQVRGQVTATREFKTEGHMVFAANQNGKLYYIYHDRGSINREDGLFKVTGSPNVGMQFRISSNTTIIGTNGMMMILKPGSSNPVTTVVDRVGSYHCLDANSHSIYWIENGQLKCSKDLGDWAVSTRVIGDVLQNQTLFWVGESMGFGFYRAGTMSVAFTFDANKGGLNDSVRLPRISGQLIGSNCCFSGSRCWFFISTQENGRTINRCYLVRADGNIDAATEAEEGDGSWLGTIRGKCDVGNALLVATDDGLVRVEANGSRLSVVKEFPDTEPWITSNSHIFPGSNGVYVVSSKEVTLLKIS